MELNNTERLYGEFIQVFPEGEKTQINSEKKATVLSQLAWMRLKLRIVWEEPQVALPELTRPEQTALHSPWTMESWMLRTWTSGSEF